MEDPSSHKADPSPEMGQGYLRSRLTWALEWSRDLDCGDSGPAAFPEVWRKLFLF